MLNVAIGISIRPSDGKPVIEGYEIYGGAESGETAVLAEVTVGEGFGRNDARQIPSRWKGHRKQWSLSRMQSHIQSPPRDAVEVYRAAQCQRGESLWAGSAD